VLLMALHRVQASSLAECRTTRRSKVTSRWWAHTARCVPTRV